MTLTSCVFTVLKNLRMVAAVKGSPISTLHRPIEAFSKKTLISLIRK